MLTFFEMIQVKLLLFKHNDVVQTLPSIQQALLGNHNEWNWIDLNVQQNYSDINYYVQLVDI